MTRKEQIQEQAMTYLAGVYGKRPDEVFEAGAEWADKHPVEDVEALKTQIKSLCLLLDVWRKYVQDK